MREITPEEAADRLREADNVTVLCHRRPDADAVGSAFALYYALRERGKDVRVLVPGGVPDRYRFLAPENYAPSPVPADPPEWPVAVDTANPSMLGPLEAAYGRRIRLAVDHHATHAAYAGETLLRPSASASAEIVGEIVRALSGRPPRGRTAECVYAGIAGDTGCFRYANTTPEAHRIAADFQEAGLDVAAVNTRLFESKSRKMARAEAALLASLRFYGDGRICVMTVPDALSGTLGLTDEDLEDLSAIPREIEGVLIGITIKQRGGECRVSVRTKEGRDASRLCGRFGGGGHRAAAGCTIPGTPEAARELLVAAAEEL